MYHGTRDLTTTKGVFDVQECQSVFDSEMRTPLTQNAHDFLNRLYVLILRRFNYKRSGRTMAHSSEITWNSDQLMRSHSNRLSDLIIVINSGDKVQ
jgi:hypothetical protein